jgi:parvulin-like peptidyl-prolyl isomerase
MMKKTMTLILAGLMLICGTGDIQAQTEDRIVAVVNNDVITLYELNRMVSAYVDRIAQSSRKEDREKITAEARTVIMSRMVDDMLVEQEAKKSGIVVKEDDVMGSLNDMLTRRRMKLDDLKAALLKEGSTFEAYKEEMRGHLMKMRLATKEVRSKISVSDEEIGNYYSKNRDIYEGKEAVRLQQILLALPKDADEETRDKLRAEAETILGKLKSGESFGLMAARFSQGPAAQTGGDLGFVEKGTLLPVVDEAAFKLKENELSPVIESAIGFHILKITDRRGKGIKSLAVVREEIKEEITNEKMEKKLQDWIQELRKKSYVDVRL